MHHIILLSACSITATINTVKSCIMKSYNGRPFPKKAYQIQILLAIWPNKFHFLNFTLGKGGWMGVRWEGWREDEREGRMERGRMGGRV